MYSARELVAKRAFDIVAASTGLVAMAPLFAVAAVAVKLSSTGPILFRQERVGKGGRLFRLFKFRSMRISGSGPLITSAGDARVTAVGRILRRSKLDELPQLINVVRGDLSLVGPRPEVPRYVAMYSDADRKFLQTVRPGITDPATVRFRNEEQILSRSQDPEQTYVEVVLPTKVRMYREYLESATLVSDLRVLASTLHAVVRPSATEVEAAE